MQCDDGLLHRRFDVSDNLADECKYVGEDLYGDFDPNAARMVGGSDHGVI